MENNKLRQYQTTLIIFGHFQNFERVCVFHTRFLEEKFLFDTICGDFKGLFLQLDSLCT